MEINTKPRMMVDQNHQILSTLGIGGAGEVYSIKNTTNNTVYAAKFARKDLKLSQAKKLMLLQRERDTMEDLQDHPNILSSYTMCRGERQSAAKRKATAQSPEFDISKQEFDIHLTTSPYHLIEYCQNGSFISYMRSQDVLPENIVIFYAEQLISWIEYIHYKGYAHLDIKLDNILLDNYFNVRLSDFGSALKTEDTPFTMFRRGTPKYMAPEVFNLNGEESFDAYKADIFSLGVCIFLMLFKRFPVYKDQEYPSTKDLFMTPEIVNQCPFDWDEYRWTELSPEIRRIVVACLNKDPDQRPQSSELIASFFLPPLNESIEGLVFDEMQTRRAKYEEMQHEKAIGEKNFIQPAVCEVNPDPSQAQDEKKSRQSSNKSGANMNASTNASTQSRN